jgi:hypothetical protein
MPGAGKDGMPFPPFMLKEVDNAYTDIANRRTMHVFQNALR